MATSTNELKLPGKKVLLIDDDVSLADMYTERLVAAGYDVIRAMDGEQGLVEAREHKPAIILLDIMMPKVNGLDVLKHLKEDPSTAGIPVILLTALIQELDKVKAITGGAVEYYVKSETVPGDLIKHINKVLGDDSDAQAHTRTIG